MCALLFIESTSVSLGTGLAGFGVIDEKLQVWLGAK